MTDSKLLLNPCQALSNNGPRSAGMLKNCKIQVYRASLLATLPVLWRYFL
jgi:hypothetical protein